MGKKAVENSCERAEKFLRKAGFKLTHLIAGQKVKDWESPNGYGARVFIDEIQLFKWGNMYWDICFKTSLGREEKVHEAIRKLTSNPDPPSEEESNNILLEIDKDSPKVKNRSDRAKRARLGGNQSNSKAQTPETDGGEDDMEPEEFALTMREVV